MKKMTRTALWLGAGLAAAGMQAQAQGPVTVVTVEKITTLPQSWSMEVPLGQLVQLNRPISCSFNRVSLTMRLNKIHLDPANKIGPTVAIFLSDRKHDAPEAPSDQSVAFIVKPASADNIPVLLLKPVGEKLFPAAILGAIDLEEDYAVTMSWDEKGEVTAQIEGEKAVASLGRPPTSITLLMGGVGAAFSDIETDFVGSPPSNCPPATANPPTPAPQ